MYFLSLIVLLQQKIISRCSNYLSTNFLASVITKGHQEIKNYYKIKLIMQQEIHDLEPQVSSMIHRLQKDKKLGNITLLKYNPKQPKSYSGLINLDDPRHFYHIQNSFNSEHIIQNIDVMHQASEYLIIAQEPYNNLLDEVKKNLSYTKKIEVLNYIAEALLVISKNKYCHNAIWPISISITTQSKKHITAKLNNFYYCKKTEKNQMLKDQRHQKISNTKYSSPEMRFYQSVTVASDIWSLGALFYELMFQIQSGITVEINQVTIKFPMGTPQWMMRLMEGMLAKQPSNRYEIGHIVAMFRSAIVSVVAGEKCFADVNKQKFIIKQI